MENNAEYGMRNTEYGMRKVKHVQKHEFPDFTLMKYNSTTLCAPSTFGSISIYYTLSLRHEKFVICYNFYPSEPGIRFWSGNRMRLLPTPNDKF